MQSWSIQMLHNKVSIEGSHLTVFLTFMGGGSQVNIFGGTFPAVRYGYFNDSKPPKCLKMHRVWVAMELVTNNVQRDSAFYQGWLSLLLDTGAFLKWWYVNICNQFAFSEVMIYAFCSCSLRQTQGLSVMNGIKELICFGSTNGLQ